MKKLSKLTILLLVLAMILPVFGTHVSSDTPSKGDLRGVWVSSVVNIDYPTKATTDSEVLKNEAISILDNAKAMGLNAVFLQVRPASDALYKSKIFPWSKYLTGTQGLSPSNDFDPLAFWITEAHNRGMELHAWINPYRVTKKNGNEPSHDFNSLDPNNPARLHPEWVVKYYDGNLYYDPGIPEVRQLVINGALELVQNYDIDGIHFDDYFYPGTNFIDQATYEKYGQGFTDINEWRRANVDALIRDLHKSIKEVKPSVSFGISPFGIWANKSTNELGSDTKGKQSYYDQYADTRKWVKEGWVDYIAPQIYWNIGYSIADYSKILAWWEDVVKDTQVKLYVGQAAYKTKNSAISSPWYGIGEIDKQLQLNEQSPEVDGSIFFSYKTLNTNPALSAAIKAFYERKSGILPKLEVTMPRPSVNLRTSMSQYYLTGASDPEKPLYINGRLVEGRSPKGYYGVLVPLAGGQNIFTISQEGTYITRVIYRDIASAAPVKMSAVDIPAASVYPQTQEYRSPGEKLVLACQAPAGSKVAVKLGGQTYEMKPTAVIQNPVGLVPVRYTYEFTMPDYIGIPIMVDFGAPEYTMDYNGIVKTRIALGTVGVIMKNAPYCAEVNKAVINTYQTPTTSDGAANELYSGMLDYITATTGSYARLSSGLWVNKGDVKIFNAETQVRATVTQSEYAVGEKWDTLKLDMTIPAATTAYFDGSLLKLNISKAYSTELPLLPENSLFSAINVTSDDDRAQYVLSLKTDKKIAGFYIEKTPTGMNLNIKKPVTAQAGDMPLTGITIMLDPGHGGSDPGTMGPLGMPFAEKAINLGTALKLQAELQKLGANVLMTRTTDTAMSLEERVTASRNAKPDLFVSIHGNSMNDNVDMTKVDGFSVFYKEALAKSAADMVFNNVLQTLNRTNKGLHVRNLYVTRGTWTPSILFETGFVPNPIEFEWLTDGTQQDAFVKTVADAIVKYFKQ